MKLKIFFIAILHTLLLGNLFSQDCEAWFFASQDTLNHLKFTFTDGSIPINSVETYLWDFGDGNTSSEQSPVHIYDTEGSYFVTLSISTNSCQDVYTMAIIVEDRPVCFADFTYYSDGSSNTVQFENLSLLPNYNDAQWSWNFGDGTTSTDFMPIHTYDLDTDYYVTLSVILGDCMSDYSQTIYMNDNYFGDNCEAMFSFEPIDPAGLSFQFWDYSWQGNDTIISYLWTFGDGGFSNDANPIHSYQQSGNYEVTLEIEANNCISLATNYIYTGDSAWYPTDCQALFWFEENQVYAYEVQFFDISAAQGQIFEWIWDFGDGEFSFMQNPTHTFLSEGEYDINLTILTEFCESNFTMQISIDEDTLFCEECHPLFFPEIEGNTVLFHDLTIGTPTWWHWNFGNGQTSDMQSPVHVFDELGVHEVAFSTGNGYCNNSLIMEIDLNTSMINMCYAIPNELTTISEIDNIDMEIYPNPAKDFININTTQNSEGIIFIYSISGKLLSETNFTEADDSKKIDISNLQSGVYVVKIKSENNIGISKFVK